MKRKMLGFVVMITASICLMGCGVSSEEAGNVSDETANVEVAESEVEEKENLTSKYESFELSSETLVDGTWDDIISNTDKGENKSPQLSWNTVEGAECYAIYMVDIDAQHWIHWKSNAVTETTLPLGWAANSDYVGPYPPSGSKHTYDIYVIAMKKPVERLKGAMNGDAPKIQQFIDAIDTDMDGNTGNIIACGHISGLFEN